MQPTRVSRSRSPFHLSSSAGVLLVLALPGIAQEGRFDPEALDHDYERFAVHRGLDRTGLSRLENTPDQNPVTDRGAQLGRVLFYDKRLSLNQKTACASCHLQEKAFADPLATSRGFRGRRTRRNSMALANLAYYSNGRFFWDERGATLEEMVLMPIQDEIEMGMSLHELVVRLEADAGYHWLFREAFGDTKVTADRIAYGLAQFLRSMVSLDSKFDDGLAQAVSIEKDFPNFSDEENLGKRIFLGLHDGDRDRSCASCHMRQEDIATPEGGAGSGAHARDEHSIPPPRRPAPVLFQGTEPTNNGIDEGSSRDDRGRAAITDDAQDAGKFKAPSLRNVELTGPYMHDGRFGSLRRVIDHYSEDIHPHPNLDPRLRTGSGGWGHKRGTPAPGPVTPIPRGTPGPETPRPGVAPTPSIAPSTRNLVRGRNRRTGFGFRPREKEALHAFLKTLTDREFVTDPKFSNPFD